MATSSDQESADPLRPQQHAPCGRPAAQPGGLTLQCPLSHPDEEDAPLFGSWRRLYAAVVVYLAVLIGLFYLFTEAFRGPR